MTWKLHSRHMSFKIVLSGQDLMLAAGFDAIRRFSFSIGIGFKSLARACLMTSVADNSNMVALVTAVGNGLTPTKAS